MKESSTLNDSLKNLFFEINSDLKKFKKNSGYPKEFTDLRNFTIGHISCNLQDVYVEIFKLNYLKAYQTILDFMIIIFKMQKFSSENADTLQLKIGKDMVSFSTPRADPQSVCCDILLLSN